MLLGDLKRPCRLKNRILHNHSVYAIFGEGIVKVRTKKNHYQLKSQLYLSALQQAFYELRQLQPVSLVQAAAA